MQDETRRRLQELIRRLEQRTPGSGRGAAAPARSNDRDADDDDMRHVGYADGGDAHALRIERRATALGSCSYRELRLASGALVGRQLLDPLYAVDGDIFELLAPDEALAHASPEELLFLDIETTGLGGAGAMTFLVATGRVEGGAFVLRQYLALAPEEEGALLEALREDAALEDEPVLATYNGRAFDAPTLDDRMTMHRRRPGFEALRQLDLLTVARTLYRGLLTSCRLAVVEAELLGITRPGNEVAGAEVPACYFRYLRTRDLRYLAPIVRHNEMDVIALAAMVARLGELATGRGRAPHGGESLAFARLLARRGHVGAAIARLEHAIETLPASGSRDEALMRLAGLFKRISRRDRAEPLWRELTARPGYARLAAQLELAKYYEHERRDYARAEAVVVDAIAIAVGAAETPMAERQRAQLEHRRVRVSRKRASARAR